MIGAIENAIVARITSASALGLLGYTFKTVDSYGGEFDAEDLARVMGKLPAAFVICLGDDRQRELTEGNWQMKATFALLVGAKSKRNEAARRHGAAGEAGSYQMARDVRVLLSGQRLGLEIAPLEPTKFQPLPLGKVGNDPVSILTVEFETTYTLVGAPDVPAAIDPANPDGPPLRPPGTLPALPGDPTPPLDPAAGLLATMARFSGITDFTGLDADWDVPRPVTDRIDLELP